MPRRLEWQEIVNLAQAEDRLRREVGSCYRHSTELVPAQVYMAQHTSAPGSSSVVPPSTPERRSQPSNGGGNGSRNPTNGNRGTWRPRCGHCGVAGHKTEECYQRQGRRSSPKSKKAPVRCSWCGGRGHAVDDCWLRAGKCHGCGDTGHDRSQCPKDEYKPTCPECGGDHLGRYCPRQPLNC